MLGLSQGGALEGVGDCIVCGAPARSGGLVHRHTRTAAREGGRTEDRKRAEKRERVKE